jgi:hypothetical protein
MYHSDVAIIFANEGILIWNQTTESWLCERYIGCERNATLELQTPEPFCKSIKSTSLVEEMPRNRYILCRGSAFD